MKYLLVSTFLSLFLLSACASASGPGSAAIASRPREFPHNGIQTAGEEQPPGQYKTPDWYILPFEFETTESFRGMGEMAGQGQIFGIAQGKSQLPPNQLLFWVLGPAFSAEEALIELRSTSELHLNTEQTVTIAGIPGTQFDAAGAGSIPALRKLLGLTSSWDIHSPEVQIRFIVLPVRDRTLVIYIEAPYDEFESFASKAEQVLSTVEFDR